MTAEVHRAKHLTIGGQTIRPGQRTIVPLPVTVDLDGNHITIYVHVVAGRQPGPTLAILSGLHGEDWQNIEVLRRLLGQLDPAAMSGSLIAMPVGNPVALGHLSRTTPDGLDSVDLNRAFPGEFSVITDQLAATISREVLAPADAMIDFHSGYWGSVQGVIIHWTDFPNKEVVEATHAMARAFGWPSIQAAPLSTTTMMRSSTGYFGGVLGRPCITPEIGGSGFDQALEEYWIETKVKGALNVMKHLGILSGQPQVPERYLVWSKRWRVNPKKGGLLVPVVGNDRLLTEVHKGELLGRVLSPYTFEEIERLEAPGRGVLFSFARQYPVRAGGWAFGVVDLDDPNTRWE